MKRRTASNSAVAEGFRGGRRERLSEEDVAYLRRLGDNIRAVRAARGMTQKLLALRSGVSVRFLAQLESGSGNASAMVLRVIAEALDITTAELLRASADDPPNFVHTVEFLRRLDPANLAKARELLRQNFAHGSDSCRRQRIALIGLRGAGKSTIGNLLGRELAAPFFELDKLIEETSGLSPAFIFDLYGQSGFRRLERRCLEDVLQKQRRFVLATGGGLVSEPATYDRLLTTCFTIWLKATPEGHMSRVRAQGDMRPMQSNPEVMADLKGILAERAHLYNQADLTVETGGRPTADIVKQALDGIRSAVEKER